MGGERMKCKKCAQQTSFFRLRCKHCGTPLFLPIFLPILFVILLVSSLIITTVVDKSKEQQTANSTIQKEETRLKEPERSVEEKEKQEELQQSERTNEEEKKIHVEKEKIHGDSSSLQSSGIRSSFLDNNEQDVEINKVSPKQEQPNSKITPSKPYVKREGKESEIRPKKPSIVPDDNPSDPSSEQGKIQEPSPKPTEPIETTEPTDLTKPVTPTPNPVDIWESVFPVYSFNENDRTVSQGTAFLVNTLGDVVTNGHVIEHVNNEFSILLDQKQLLKGQGKLIGYDHQLDVALIRVEALKNRNPLQLNVEKEAQLHTGIETYGSKFKDNVTQVFFDDSIYEEMEFHKKEGEIIDTASFIIDGEPYEYTDMYVINVGLQRGNSGGPLVKKGSNEVIGINSAVDVAGNGYSIPITQVAGVIEKWSHEPMTPEQLEAAQKEKDRKVEVQREQEEIESESDIQQLPNVSAASEQKDLVESTELQPKNKTDENTGELPE